MRLRCEVRVSNRLLPSLNLRKGGKGTFTHVSLGRKPGDKEGPVYLMLCTAQNRNGEKYALKKNVEQIFARFVKDGKATIRLTSPDDDILFSKAEPTQLSMFLKLVRLASEGKDFPDKVLSTLAPVSSKQVEKPATNLVVTKPSEYPMAFPKTLENLSINNCCFRRISPQIMTLSRLTKLDMSCNQLTSVPEAFRQLTSLQSLCLAANKFTNFPAILLSGSFPTCLCLLDLRHNEMKSLPSDLIVLKSLHTLNLSHNQLKILPESLGFMRSLRNLSVSANGLQFLPGSFLSHMFEALDLSDNAFMTQLPTCDVVNEKLPVPTLAECAARAIVAMRVEYMEDDLDIFSRLYLTKAHFCMCGKPCFEASGRRFVKRPVPSVSCYSQGDVPLLLYYCSRGCVRKFA